jgi:hypothetical protein
LQEIVDRKIQKRRKGNKRQGIRWRRKEMARRKGERGDEKHTCRRRR